MIMNYSQGLLKISLKNINIQKVSKNFENFNNKVVQTFHI